MPWIDQGAVSLQNFSATAISAGFLAPRDVEIVLAAAVLVSLSQLVQYSAVGMPSVILLQGKFRTAHDRHIAASWQGGILLSAYVGLLGGFIALAYASSASRQELLIGCAVIATAGVSECARRLHQAVGDWTRPAIAQSISLSLALVGMIISAHVGLGAAGVMIGFAAGNLAALSVYLFLSPMACALRCLSASGGFWRANTENFLIARFTIASVLVSWIWSQGVLLAFQPAIGTSQFVGIRLALSVMSPLALLTQPLEIRWVQEMAKRNENLDQFSAAREHARRISVQWMLPVACGGALFLAAISSVYFPPGRVAMTLLLLAAVYQVLAALAKPNIASLRALDGHSSLLAMHALALPLIIPSIAGASITGNPEVAIVGYILVASMQFGYLESRVRKRVRARFGEGQR